MIGNRYWDRNSGVEKCARVQQAGEDMTHNDQMIMSQPLCHKMI